MKMLRLAVLLSVVASVPALDNGLALRPPVGWMSWLGFGCNTDCKNQPKKCLSEDLIKRTADAMVSKGYVKYGYEYIIIDDCWAEKKRDPTTGKLVADKKRFKSGIKALADYVHNKGMKFGLYTDIGTNTCQGYPGSLGHEELDANTFAEWGVDYVKLDGCYYNSKDMEKGYTNFGKWMNQTNRPMLYSCSWPAYVGDNVDYKKVAKVCNIWRNYGDIDNSWSSVLNIMDWYAQRQDKLNAIAGPGQWHDLDQLVLGHLRPSKLSFANSLNQYFLWMLLNVPLLLSVDMDTLVEAHRYEIERMSQLSKINNRFGGICKRIYHDDKMDVWLRTLTHYVDNDTLLYPILRSSDGPTNFTQVAPTGVVLQDVNIQQSVSYIVKDFMTKEDLGEWDPRLPFTFIEPNRLYHLSPKKLWETDGRPEKIKEVHTIQ